MICHGLICEAFEQHNIVDVDDLVVEDYLVDEDELFDQTNYDESFLKHLKEVVFYFEVVSIKRVSHWSNKSFE